LLNRPAHNFRAAWIGFVICLILALMSGVTLILPEDPRHKSPPPNPLLYGGIAAASAIGAIALAVRAVSLKRKSREYLARELQRTGAQFYDVGFATLRPVGIGGFLILSKDNLYFLIPPPQSSGLVGGMVDQHKWDAITPITTEYSAMPQTTLNHPDWPRIEKIETSRVLTVAKPQVFPPEALPSRHEIGVRNMREVSLTIPDGAIILSVDPFSRQIVRQRFAELQWPFPL
jgi:hypothetical protein